MITKYNPQSQENCRAIPLVLDVCGGFDILREIKPGPNVAGNLFRREK
jgi:hypothetical protein